MMTNTSKGYFSLILTFFDFVLVFRAGNNKREAPGKAVIARPSKCLAQLRSVSDALVSTLQKHRSETSKLIRFGTHPTRQRQSRADPGSKFKGRNFSNIWQSNLITGSLM